MNVDELLRERGDQWQTPDVDDPDLDAAIGRSARRNRIARVAVAAASVLAVGATAWAVSPARGDIPAIPAPAVTPSVPTPTRGATPTPGPAAPSNDQLLEVARTVRSDFRTITAVPVTTVTVVQSTMAVAGAAAGLVVPEGTDPIAPAWVMEWKGTFRCDACRHPRDKVASQPVLRALVSSELEVVAVATFAEPADLGALGHVSTLSLASKQPDFDNNRLTSSIKRGLAMVGTARVTRVMGYWTTEWRVLHNVFGETRTPPSYRSVWLVVVDGSFTCSTCTRLQDSDHGTSVAMVIDATTYQVGRTAISTRTIDPGVLMGRAAMFWKSDQFR
jgi:hypothetical protein